MAERDGGGVEAARGSGWFESHLPLCWSSAARVAEAGRRIDANFRSHTCNKKAGVKKKLCHISSGLRPMTDGCFLQGATSNFGVKDAKIQTSSGSRNDIENLVRGPIDVGSR